MGRPGSGDGSGASWGGRRTGRSREGTGSGGPEPREQSGSEWVRGPGCCLAREGARSGGPQLRAGVAGAGLGIPWQSGGVSVQGWCGRGWIGGPGSGLSLGPGLGWGSREELAGETGRVGGTDPGGWGSLLPPHLDGEDERGEAEAAQAGQHVSRQHVEERPEHVVAGLLGGAGGGGRAPPGGLQRDGHLAVPGLHGRDAAAPERARQQREEPKLSLPGAGGRPDIPTPARGHPGVCPLLGGRHRHPCRWVMAPPPGGGQRWGRGGLQSPVSPLGSRSLASEPGQDRGRVWQMVSGCWNEGQAGARECGTPSAAAEPRAPWRGCSPSPQRQLRRDGR